MALAALGLPVGPPAAATPQGSCAPAWTPAPLPQGGRDASFYGIETAAANDVWAVGSRYTGAGDVTLAEHWDGVAWTRVPTPTPASGGYLRDAAAVGPADVWAVGYANAPGGYATLTEHWDGSTWTVVPSPSIPGIANSLASVDVAGPDDVWAVGSWIDTDGDYEPLVEHWDGTVWSALDVPGQEGVDDLLNGVAVAGPDDAWAVGFTSGPGGSRTLIEHWDGVAWSAVPGPNPSATANALNAVSVAGPHDAWAVGTDNDGHDNVTLVARWDGTAWAAVPSASFPGDGNVLNGVTVVAGGDAWAVGYHYPTGDPDYRTLIEHWDGRSWSIVSSPDPGDGQTYQLLTGVAAVPSGRAWTAGSGVGVGLVQSVCETTVGGGGFVPRRAAAGLGDTVTWRVPATATAPHSITDPTGMGLFDSGLREPGASFAFDVPGAATYVAVDTPTGHRGALGVPVAVSPAAGGVATTFTVRWADEGPRPGFAFDVQIRRPGAPSFVTWRSNQTTARAAFVPDAGTGAYTFRAWVVATATGAHTAWSPPASIEVT